MLLLVALASNNRSQLEIHYQHALRAHKSASFALDKAMKDPQATADNIAMLKNVLADVESTMRKIEKKMPPKALPKAKADLSSDSFSHGFK